MMTVLAESLRFQKKQNIISNIVLPVIESRSEADILKDDIFIFKHLFIWACVKTCHEKKRTTSVFSKKKIIPTNFEDKYFAFHSRKHQTSRVQ